MTPKPWYTRLYRYLAEYGEETPALIVATPLVTDKVVRPLSIVLPIKHVTGDIEVTVKRKPGRPKASGKPVLKPKRKAKARAARRNG